MKKLFFLSFSFLLLLFTNSESLEFIALKNYKENATYSFYVTSQILTSQNYYVINNAGLGSIVTTLMPFSIKVKNSLRHIIGESIRFNGEFCEVSRLLDFYKGKVVKSEIIGGEIYSVYVNAPTFFRSILIDNEKVNLQICYNKGVITLGTPIILGDY